MCGHANTLLLDSMYKMGVIRNDDILKSYTKMKGFDLELTREPIKHFAINNNRYRCILSFKSNIGVNIIDIVATENDMSAALDILEYYLDYDPGDGIFPCGLNKSTLKNVIISLRTELDNFYNKLLFIDILEYDPSTECLNNVVSFQADFINDLPVLIDKIYETFLMDL